MNKTYLEMTSKTSDYSRFSINNLSKIYEK